MKRSEFHGKLERILIEYAPDMPPDFYVATADAIFKMTEEVGMLPPIIREKSFKILPSGEMTYAVHEWESENEI